MQYIPETCVWELTMNCNLRCKHCGSSCSDPRKDELTTEEALKLADELGAMNLRWISLIGGELFLFKDWDLIVKRLSDYGINICIITNGTLINKRIIHKMERSRIVNLSISIDGIKKTHDKIRGAKCYDKCRKAFEMARKEGITTSATTTVIKENLGELPEIKNELIKMGVPYWQIQIGLPEGNLANNTASLIDPQDIKKIIDFAYEVNMQGNIMIYLPDTIGYYTQKEAIARQIATRSAKAPMWDGCNAGIRSFGILSNGDIVGCTSIRDPKYVEGNVRKRSLKDIWEDNNSFAWRRNLTAEKLKGKCKTCKYVSKCLGGCSNARLTSGDIYGENRFCAYSAAMYAAESK